MFNVAVAQILVQRLEQVDRQLALLHVELGKRAAAARNSCQTEVADSLAAAQRQLAQLRQLGDEKAKAGVADLAFADVKGPLRQSFVKLLLCRYLVC